MEELNGSSEAVSFIFTSNIGVLAHVLSYYNYAHISAYMMQTLWTGSRSLFFKNDFGFILKETKKSIKLKIEDTKKLKLIEKVKNYYTFDILIVEYLDELVYHIFNLIDMQFSFNLIIENINQNNLTSMLKVISLIMGWDDYNIKILNISQNCQHEDFMPYIQNLYLSKSFIASVQMNDEFIQCLQNSLSNSENSLSNSENYLDHNRIEIQLEDISSHPDILK